MIKIENVSVTFASGKRKVEAVKNVSLSIEEGEIFGIVGSSGAGKSTLLRTINLLERPTEGSIVIGGTDISSFRGEVLRQVRLHIGMIFQHFNLIRAKTVYDNIAFSLKIGETPKDQIPGRVEELLSLVGLSDKSNAYPSQLSGGQKQRVGIARALANHPKILLCDEPTSALDLETTKSILHLLKDINQKLGITIVIITHEMDVVKTICDRVAVMKEGEVVEMEDVYEIFTNPKHSFTKQLVHHTLNLELPEQIFKDLRGILLKVIYRGSSAVDPVLSQTAKQFQVDLSIVHGKIEYIKERPFGILAVNIEGSEVEKAIEYIKQNTAFTEVIHIG